MQTIITNTAHGDNFFFTLLHYLIRIVCARVCFYCILLFNSYLKIKITYFHRQTADLLTQTYAYGLNASN